MTSVTENPTLRFYGQLQYVFDFFNTHLFDNQLPQMILTVQRDRGTMGYFSPTRWNHEGKRQYHELALNPTYFASHKLIEIFQTIVHEQVHAWQHHFGQPSRKTYHNRQWAEKMIAVGLMPTSTGAPGGKATGQSIGDYPIEGGLFKTACVKLFLSGFDFKWVDRRASYISSLEIASSGEFLDEESDMTSTAELDEPEARSLEFVEVLLNTIVRDLIPNVEYEMDAKQREAATAKEKVTYLCPNPDCSTRVWGKPGLSLICSNPETKCSNRLIPKQL